MEKTKSEFRKQREGARAEIFKLEQKIKVLQTEEEKKSNPVIFRPLATLVQITIISNLKLNINVIQLCSKVALFTSFQ